MSISAMLTTKGAVTGTSLREQIEEEYERIVVNR